MHFNIFKAKLILVKRVFAYVANINLHQRNLRHRNSN